MEGEQPDKHRSLVAATLPTLRSASVAYSIPSPVSDPASGRLLRFQLLELSGRVRLTTTSTVRMQARCCFGLRRRTSSSAQATPQVPVSGLPTVAVRIGDGRHRARRSREAIGMTGADRHGRSCIPPSRGQTPNLSGDQVSSSRTASSPCSSGDLGEPDR